MIQVGMFTLDDDGFLTWGPKRKQLSEKEIAIMRYFMSNPKVPISRQQLASTANISIDQVDVAIFRLRQKIERKPHVPMYLRTAKDIGYTFDPG